MHDWTEDELAQLRARYCVTSDAKLERMFARDIEEIDAKARELALGKDKRRFPGAVKMPRWSDAEVAKLRKLYPKLPSVEVARRLGRSHKAVTGKAEKLGLAKSEERLVQAGRENIRVRHRRATGAA